VIWDLGGVLLRTEDWQPRQQLADSLKINRRDLEWLVFDSPSALKGQLGEISADQHWIMCVFLWDCRKPSISASEKHSFLATGWISSFLAQIRSLNNGF